MTLLRQGGTREPTAARDVGAEEGVRETGVPCAVAGRHLPALDGLRALAVAGVIAYHLGYGWARGGYLGVDLFFVLSGFLITSLLVEEWAVSGVLRLGAFWTRRARRLLPGLLTMLVALSLWFAFTHGGPVADIRQLRGDALATIFYVANWHQLFAKQQYFAQFATPSPLQHTWSLAIEEQFYLVWPLVILGLLALRRRARRVRNAAHLRGGPSWLGGGVERWRGVGLVVAVGGALVSAGWMAFLSHHGASLDRMYYGTDTRAFDLLAGATVAMLVVVRPQPGPRARRWLHLAAVAAVAVLAYCWWRAGGEQGPPGWMFEWGFALCALAAAVVIADVRQTASGPLGAVLGLRPLRWIGKISYGLYLWHWPVIVELTSQRTGVSGIGLDAIRIGVTVVAATLSYYLIEQPVRRGHLARLPHLVRLALAPAAMVATAGVALATMVPAVAAASASSVRLSSHTRVPGVGGFSHEKPIVLPAGRVLSAQDPLRVLVVGDSVMYTDTLAIAAAFDSTGVVDVSNMAFPGWGLTTKTTWQQDVSGAVSELHPEIVVAMWSWDNAFALRYPATYRKELREFVNILLTPGDGVDGVVFQQFPVMGPVISIVNPEQAHAKSAANSAGVKEWNLLVSELPSVFPGKVMYLPIGPAVELDGGFSQWLPPPGEKIAPKPDWVRVRMEDNLHFCPAGAARYADALLTDMTLLFRLHDAGADWSTASWTHDPRYYTNTALAGNPCPDDHPGP